ncbi:MAG: minichromosome maintenance protein MCM [Hadesarchaea archaeon]|nr:minichromosome maintenance protein MCM [Hadesarchaea archaeon]
MEELTGLEERLKEKLREFFSERKIRRKLEEAETTGKLSLVVDFEDLMGYEYEEKRSLAEVLQDSPRHFFKVANELLVEETGRPKMQLRVRGAMESTKIRNLRAEHVGKFIQVEGILTRASEIKPEIREALFRCLHCGELNTVLQSGDESYREPLSCQNPNCRKRGPFKLEVEKSEFRDWQSLRIQERHEELRGGRMPMMLDCVVRDDLVDVAVPGNHVVMTGILEVFQEGGFKQKKKTFRKILDISYLEVLQKGVEETELTEEDEKKIKEMVKDPWLYNKIIQSVAPSVHGYEAVKEGIALMLFGCDPLELPDKTRVRGDIHILLTGDPGVAKSMMLSWTASVAPRGLYTSGKKATGAGLTATAVRDELGGGWTLEAGALVIADGGVACIDEFDKMSEEDRSAILEALEQQTISVAKAGIVATLNSRTSVLAASNPKMGRLDRSRNLVQQIGLEPVILSRFDLIFILRDEPRGEIDKKIARHMLELHRKPEIAKPPIDSEMLRKLIIYARKYIHPRLKDEKVIKKMEEFYVKNRSVAERGEAPVPITPRQLESMIRLAKASARMHFREEVTEEDVIRAIELISKYLHEAGFDASTGKVDVDILMTGRSKSQREKIQRVIDLIGEVENKHGGMAPVEEIVRRAKEEGIEENFVMRVVEEEKRDGFLYEPKQGYVTRVVKG